jgi:hypothetical protein
MALQIYRNYRLWTLLFPATIAGVRLLRIENDALVVEVLHKHEGVVLNQLRDLSSEAIELHEWKRRYEARFIHRFESCGQDTRSTLSAEIAFKGAWRLLEPFVKPWARHQIVRHVVKPLQRHVRTLSMR